MIGRFPSGLSWTVVDSTPVPAEVPSMRRKKGGALFILVLNIYGAALLIAAWPNGSDFGRLQPIHEASRELFRQLHTRSASYVFSGNRGAWKRQALCISVLGIDGSGGQRELYETYPECITPDFRIFEDTFDVLLMRSGHSREMKGFLGANARELGNELRVLRRSPALDRVSRYFCYSQHVKNGDIVEVNLHWKIAQVNYRSGKTRQDSMHVHSYDCQKDRAIRRFRQDKFRKKPKRKHSRARQRDQELKSGEGK